MNKFNAKKTIIDGIKFDSKKEANYYQQLLLQKKAKNDSDRVVHIELQPRFDIIVNWKFIGFYKADFRVKYADNKGSAYQLFRLKKKLVEATYNIEIIEK
ncbi:DUF1064 domain-containing protein, partial [Candidatus Pacearchaeota archaeon]|nr:DUF1064 domain-containing protein [Candidatus Pacearchaeota archaeon]